MHLLSCSLCIVLLCLADSKFLILEYKNSQMSPSVLLFKSFLSPGMRTETVQNDIAWFFLPSQ